VERIKLLTSLLVRNRKNRRVPVAERFSHFRAIGTANDAFLNQLGRLQERLERFNALEGTAAGAAESLRSQIQSMVHSLRAMTGGAYEELMRRHEILDQEAGRLMPTPRRIENGPIVVWPADADALNPHVVGPKAARLAEVALKTNLKVPPFFSISAFAYRLFMDTSGVQDCVNRMLSSLDMRNPGAIKQFSDTLSEEFDKASVPPVLETELREAYRRLAASNPGVGGVAVRSSAVVEDSESSFAGQFESILNVLEAGLPGAYKAVVASKYREEALRYSVARGFIEEDIAMPVLVMAMVRPSTSGVAYSCSPYRPEVAMVTAVPGLAQAMDSDRIIPDVFMVSTELPEQVEVSAGKRAFTLRCADDGGLTELQEDAASPRAPALEKESVLSIARAARALEDYFGSPQDMEWAMDESGSLHVVQARPLQLSRYSTEPPSIRPEIEGYRILARGTRASGGVVSGFVAHLFNARSPGESMPEGAILCIPTTTPRLAAIMPRVRAIVAASGSPTGHMATVAREFEIPCLVGVENAFSSMLPGTLVTVDADAGVVYEGVVTELLQPARSAGTPAAQKDPARENLQSFLEKVAPLTLTEPDGPSFTPGNCRTLHDIARFVHQKAMMEMFSLQSLSSQERRSARRLLWRAPIEVMLLDLGGGLAPDAGKSVPLDSVRSVPLLALIEGMTDPRLRWAGPIGFDLKGFMSVVVRSAADDQRYGEPNYCICAADYVHFASRLAYHFATADALCGKSINENYARFLFFGGAAVAARREWRAHFLATVLHCNGFNVKQAGDRVEGLLAKRNSEQIEEALVMLGRLMVASRHLDMVIESEAAANALAQAFLSGDYAFERVRKMG
jgi:pyruvate,water dikinase